MRGYFLQGWDLIDFESDETVEHVTMWTAANGVAMHRSEMR